MPHCVLYHGQMCMICGPKNNNRKEERMSDEMSGEGFRAIVRRMTEENMMLVQSYKNMIVLLALSAGVNVLMLLHVIYEGLQ